jgi:beta-lactamase superfamily II metal-dependent hydrolase
VATDTLQVRVYNVRFGDAVLVSVPERSGRRTTIRHLLIDVGNVLGTEGGEDEVFGPVVEDILEVLGGRPVDLYVMSHEHLDHVQGLFWAATKLQRTIDVRYAWLPASAEPGYYDRHPEAREKRMQLVDAYEGIRRLLATSKAVPAAVSALVRNNDVLAAAASPSRTRDCVEFLRTLADESKTSYVHRESRLARRHPFREAQLSIWAPEEDTSMDYGRFQPMALGMPAAPAPGNGRTAKAKPPRLVPPAGVDAGAFYDLVGSRRAGFMENLLSIDKAANNTSIVLCLEWRGWRLLFPGDAEERSWHTMDKLGQLKPVHFLKVSHHGSHNGTPPPELLAKVLPEESPDGRPRSAAVSTCEGSYHGVPHDPTLTLIRQRCELRTTAGTPDGEALLFEFDAD